MYVIEREREKNIYGISPYTNIRKRIQTNYQCVCVVYMVRISTMCCCCCIDYYFFLCINSISSNNNDN